MSPKEQATAAQLLARWLALHGDLQPDPVKWVEQLDELIAETKTFVDHEDHQG